MPGQHTCTRRAMCAMNDGTSKR